MRVAFLALDCHLALHGGDGGGAGGAARPKNGGEVTGGRKRRGRMKGGAATTTASSDVDVNVDVTGRRGRDERARGDGPA